MSIFSVGGGNAAADYEIEQSLRFEGSDNSDLSRTPSSASNRRTWTWSGWVKRSDVSANIKCMFSSYTGGNDNSRILFHTDYSLRVIEVVANSTIYDVKTTQLFRDVGTWYHIVVAVDTTQSTASDRIKIYVNGSQVTDFATSSYPSLNYETMINNTGAHFVGNQSAAGGKDIDGYLAEVHFVDGQALTAASFGETNADTNQWVPKRYSGSHGTNGFYLKFQDSSSLGDDSSGNTNDFTATNLAATDQVLDSPTNNFCTINPIDRGSTLNGTFSEGNTRVVINNDLAVRGTIMYPKTGKWYAECLYKDDDKTTEWGFRDLNDSNKGFQVYTSGTVSQLIIRKDNVNVATPSYPGVNTIYSIAYDADTGDVEAFVNGSSVYSGTLGTVGLDYIPHFLHGSSDPAFYSDIVVNYGQDSSFAGNKTAQNNTDGNGKGDFYYSPPSGYLALCEDNLPDPSIADPTAHFNTVLYTGDGANNRTISGVGFSPDWLWNKSRSATGHNMVYDSVRGSSGGYLLRLNTNATSAETAQSDEVKSFTSDGFITDSSQNASGVTYVAWNWKAGGTASSNTDGTITSSVSANTDAGFSIISYTGNGTNGATVGHGLSQKPDLVIYKARSQASHDWIVYSSPLGATKRLKLNLTDAESTSSSQFNDTEPTSSVVTLGTFNNINQSSEDFIAYAFHSVEGYSKIGKYSGNGAQDGPFVYTGFRPAFIFIKRITNAGSNSYIVDNKRIGYNHFVYLTDEGSNKYVWPDSNAAEGNGNTAKGIGMDIVSNGFKFRTSGGDYNASSNDYLFYAIAESPFKTANAR